MAIGLDDLDDYSVQDVTNYEQPLQEESVVLQQESNNDEGFISDFLKTRGIDDMSKIMFEDDDNQIIERNWNDLSKEEKINILNTPLELPQDKMENNLSDEEIELLNSIRKNNMTPSLYVNTLKGDVQPLEPRYKIDDLSDDELYLLDLESKVGELSDEEAASALNSAKVNEDFYKKYIDGIRKEYKEREDFQIQQEQAQLEQELLEAFLQYQQQVVDSINNFNSIGNLDLNLEDEDKEELAEFMLSQDDNGVNYLYQALQDPQILTKVAWFVLNGEEAFNSVSDYFTNLIKQVSEALYKKGFEEGKKGVSSRPQVVIKKENKTNHQFNNEVYSSIDDL